MNVTGNTQGHIQDLKMWKCCGYPYDIIVFINDKKKNWTSEGGQPGLGLPPLAWENKELAQGAKGRSIYGQGSGGRLKTHCNESYATEP